MASLLGGVGAVDLGNLGSVVADKINNMSFLDTLLPEKLRGQLMDTVKNFSDKYPKVAAFVLAHPWLAAIPLLIFIVLVVVILLISIVVGLLVGLLAATIFIVGAVLVALLVIFPLVFITTTTCSSVFFWGGIGYLIFNALNKDEDEKKPKSKKKFKKSGPTVGKPTVTSEETDHDSPSPTGAVTSTVSDLGL